MSPIHKHMLAALAWLVVCPLVFVALFVRGVAAPTGMNLSIASVIWGLGLVACFGSWAWRDAPAYGKTRSLAMAFTAAWLLVFLLAAFPYLFVTRGAREGAAASLKFIAYCVACAAVFMAVGMVSRQVL
ncbi:MAG: hypothetical protein H7346_02785 [Burkholderiaceae bacterium]|nr:hypothetical protein [Burkholderiaceae bacterium]